jgi:arabinofuranosyltransferase
MCPDNYKLKRNTVNMNKRTLDILALVSLMALTVLFAFGFIDFSIPPQEDAAILMRYADHVAQGEGIVWNLGESPVDGATDFLFMIIVALFHYIGFSLEAGARIVTVFSHFSTVALIYFGMRQLQQSGVLPAWLSAAYFTFGPGLYFAAACFGTPFFSLAVASAWLLGQRLIFLDSRTMGSYLVFSLACLIVGLIRPEGVLISVFMLIAISMLVPFRESRQLVIIFGAVFIVLGGSYFVWRWGYFGYPLPNPFYKKGGGLHLDALLTSVKWSGVMLYPIVIAFLLSLRSKSTLYLGIAFSIPIVGSVGMWVLLSDEMNIGGRFQYPILAIAILSWYPLVRTLRNDFRLPTFSSLNFEQKMAVISSAAFVTVVVFTMDIFVPSVTSRTPNERDGRYDVGLMLSEYADKSYTIATSEAGLLPLYSKWRAIDTWGLNDQWIAHHGLITKEYLHKQRPDIIMFNAYFSPLDPPASGHSQFPLWDRHVLTLKTYAEEHDYTLAAVFGISPYTTTTHYYYVRPGIPDHDEIVQRIRSMDYAWYENGEIVESYANP